MSLVDDFGLGPHRYVFLIGGGGKTSLMFALAHELVAMGHAVLTTTSTRILQPAPEDSLRVVVDFDIPALVRRLKDELREPGHVTAARSRVGELGEKLAGFAPAELDAIEAAGAADYVLVEADGSAGRPLKAHMEHEPVLSGRAELVIAVVGLSGLGKPASDASVHRATLWCERLGQPPGHVVTAEDVAAMFFHPEGYLKKVPSRARLAVFLSQAGPTQARRHSHLLCRALEHADGDRRIACIVTGELREADAF